MVSTPASRSRNSSWARAVWAKRPAGETDPGEAQRVLAGFAEAGGNFLDTSDAYLGGEAERIIGEFIAPHRADFVVASKFGRTSGRSPSLGALGNTRKAMATAVEASLKRLRTDHIDLYFTHFDDGVTPVEEIARGFEDLARAGKILYAGLSNFPAWRVAVGATLAELRGWVPISAIEVEYNLLQRTAERELLPMAEALGLGVLGYSPLAAGVLSGKPRPGAAADDAHRERVVGTVVAVAAELGTDPAKVATAWVSARGARPILGAKTRVQLEDSLAGGTIRLTGEQIARLDGVSAGAARLPARPDGQRRGARQQHRQPLGADRLSGANGGLSGVETRLGATAGRKHTQKIWSLTTSQRAYGPAGAGANPALTRGFSTSTPPLRPNERVSACDLLPLLSMSITSNNQLAGRRILVATVPQDGHFNPLTGLAKYLQTLDCDVRWYTGLAYADRVRQLDLPYLPFQEAKRLRKRVVCRRVCPRPRHSGPV